MKDQYKEAIVKYVSIIQTDAWDGLFHCISRLITVEKDLESENVNALQKLYDFAEEVREQILGESS